MLQIDIYNRYYHYQGIFGPYVDDNPPEAINKALDDLIKNHEFSQDNFFFQVPDAKSEHREIPKGFYGILIMPENTDVIDSEQVQEKLDQEDTYYITVTKPTFNAMEEL